MIFQRPSDNTLYEALIARDPAYEGFAYVGVKSTGVFCRLTCAARKPKRDNAVFFDTVAACLQAGFRPCKRCQPMVPPGAAGPLVKQLLDALEREPDKRWRGADIIAMGFDPSTVRRTFKRRFGMSFLEIARLRRVGQAAEQLVAGARVIEAQLDAGFESGSGFHSAIVRLFGDAPAHLRSCELLRADWIETPLGQMLAIADRHALHLLEFVDRKALPSEIRQLRKRTGAVIALGRYAPIDQITAELNAYFDGRCAEFTTQIAQFGSLFQRKVWSALRSIPPGATRSYSGIAADIGHATATRAVARANGANPIAIAVPCHRVIGADGSLTGYGGGLCRKRWLLEHERRMALDS